MKKIILVFIAIFGISTLIYAEEARYKVTIQVQINYKYWEDGSCVGEDNEPGTPQTIYVMAETPYEAEKKALNECSSMCSSGLSKDEGFKKYSGDGKIYKCTSTKEPYNATAVLSYR